jgi:integrase
MIPAGFYPPRRHHRARLALRLWWHRQQRPTPASAARIVDVVRPALTAEAALLVAFVAVLAALGLTIHEAAGLGWHDVEGGAWFAVVSVSAAVAWVARAY